MDKEIKMKLLEELMDEMDGSISSKLKPKDEVQVTEIEQKEMPIEDVKEMLAEKMGAADLGEVDETEQEGVLMDDEDSSDELDVDDMEDEELEDEVAEGDIPYQGGRLAEKLKALKKLRG